jgi:hypothetical protein
MSISICSDITAAIPRAIPRTSSRWRIVLFVYGGSCCLSLADRAVLVAEGTVTLADRAVVARRIFLPAYPTSRLCVHALSMS